MSNPKVVKTISSVGLECWHKSFKKPTMIRCQVVILDNGQRYIQAISGRNLEPIVGVPIKFISDYQYWHVLPDDTNSIEFAQTCMDLLDLQYN